MKYLFVVLTAGLLFGLNSCGYVERDFLGKWQVYDLELQSEWRGNIVDDDMREYYENVFYEFLPEGKMVYHEYGVEGDGEWDLNDGENLEMKYTMHTSWRSKRENLKCKILSCTAGKMALQMKFQENETWVFYLKEVNN
mmetsp:Transcript_9234/g.10719  ORF Transcript_9234/g.10719 Transcript_9234/m.10719 type:complete len:139 (-) Transcript_9234:194-610(-)